MVVAVRTESGSDRVCCGTRILRVIHGRDARATLQTPVLTSFATPQAGSYNPSVNPVGPNVLCQFTNLNAGSARLILKYFKS